MFVVVFIVGSFPCYGGRANALPPRRRRTVTDRILIRAWFINDLKSSLRKRGKSKNDKNRGDHYLFG
jgi:hypothetical protein